MESRAAGGDSVPVLRRWFTDARVWVASGVAVVSLVVAGLLGWGSVAASAADDVEVWTGPPQCRGVSGVGPALGESGPQPVVNLGKGMAAKEMRCVLRVFVDNQSGRTLHLDRAVVPIMGPVGGAVVRVDMRQDPARWSVGDAEGEAVHTLDVDVESKETTWFEVHYVFRPRGCTQGTMWTYADLEASVLGRSVTLPQAHMLSFRHLGHTPGCRDPE